MLQEAQTSGLKLSNPCLMLSKRAPFKEHVTDLQSSRLPRLFALNGNIDNYGSYFESFDQPGIATIINNLDDLNAATRLIKRMPGCSKKGLHRRLRGQIDNRSNKRVLEGHSKN